MAHRQVETTSIHSSSYHTGWIRVSSDDDSPWEVVAHSNNSNENPDSEEGGERVLPCTYLDLATHINMHGAAERLKKYPHNKGYFRWNKDVHFHEYLRLPSSPTAGGDISEKGILVLFEAMASEGVAVALSSQPGFQKGATVEITFGAVGNTKTTILRKQKVHNQTVSVPCRVCHEGTWISLWVGMYKGKAFAGVGSLPGHKCLAFLDLNEHVESNTGGGDGTGTGAGAGPVGIKKSDADNDMTINPEGARGIETKDSPNSTSKHIENLVYVGLGNAAQQARPVKIRHLHVTAVPSFVAHQLENTTESSTMDVLMDQQDEIDDDALKEYQSQCRKARARAQKFGIEYKEPSLAAVVPWSQARKLRANPQKGFITGIDVTDPDELSKQEARKSRFGINSKKRELDDDNDDDAIKKEIEEDATEAAPAMSDNNEDSLPIIQAWDNEELVRFQRSDPPPSLWKRLPEGEAESDAADEFAMETDKPTLVPEKIHVFSIDWSAFKQIRSEDLMAYFNVYGPSYVEWLSDLGCNILFEDKFSAVRAMQAMTHDIPSPPPSELNEGDDEYVPPDLGAMGWKLGRKLVVKIKNDRFGRRGTKARILMRPATSLDILIERPNSWPEPPPGFSTKLILGPGSDYNTNAVEQDDGENDDDNNNNNNNNNNGSTKQRRKRRRRSSDRDKSTNNNENINNAGANRKHKNTTTGKRRQRGGQNPNQPSAPDLLNQGLSSTRAGFTLEDMEALRASKKNATSK